MAESKIQYKEAVDHFNLDTELTATAVIAALATGEYCLACTRAEVQLEHPDYTQFCENCSMLGVLYHKMEESE